MNTRNKQNQKKLITIRQENRPKKQSQNPNTHEHENPELRMTR